MTERPDETREGEGEWERGHKTHLPGRQESSEMPLVYVRTSSLRAISRSGGGAPPPPSVRLGVSGYPFPTRQAQGSWRLPLAAPQVRE